MITLPTKKSGFMRVLFLMLLVMTLMNCSENSRKCVEFEITEEDINDIKIATTECTKWADEVTKTSN